MESTHFSGKVTQKAIIERDGKILVCRGIGDSIWEFPGGRLNAGEVPVEGLAREIQEEFGLTVADIRPLHVEPSFHIKNQTHQLLIAYTCSAPASELQVDANEVEEYKWVTREELSVLPMFPDCAAVIKLL